MKVIKPAKVTKPKRFRPQVTGGDSHMQVSYLAQLPDEDGETTTVHVPRHQTFVLPDGVTYFEARLVGDPEPIPGDEPDTQEQQSNEQIREIQHPIGAQPGDARQRERASDDRPQLQEGGPIHERNNAGPEVAGQADEAVNESHN